MLKLDDLDGVPKNFGSPHNPEQKQELTIEDLDGVCMSMPRFLEQRYSDGHKLTQDDLNDLGQADKVLKLKADQKQIWNKTQATGTGMYWHVLYGHHQNHREVMKTVEAAGGRVTGQRHSPTCSSCAISKLTMKRTFRGGPQGLEEQIEGMTGQNYAVPKNKKEEVRQTIADLKREAMIRLEDLDLKEPIIKSQEAPVGAHIFMDFMDFVQWSYGHGQSVKLFVFTDATTSAGYPVMVDKKSEAPEALRKVVSMLKSYGHTVKEITYDPAGENMGSAMSATCQALNIRQSPVTSRCQYLNSIVESKIKRVKNMITVTLYHN